MPGSYSQFFAAIRMQESSNDYSEVNFDDYLGAYQFGEEALIDLGFVNADANPRDNNYSGGFTGKLGINSITGFLDSIPAQDAAAAEWWSVLWNYIRSFDLEFYDQQTLNGVTLTKSGMIAGAHLVGIGNLKTYIESGGTMIPQDGNTPPVPITQYITQFADHDMPSGFLNNLGAGNTIGGGSGNDVLRGFGGNDTLSGKGGDDILIGGGGADTFVAGTGIDTFWGGDADDVAFEPGGNDTVSYSGVAGALALTFAGYNLPFGPDTVLIEVRNGASASRLWGIERIIGSPGRDYFDFDGVVPDDYFLTVDAGGGGETYSQVINMRDAGDGMRLSIGSSSGTLYSAGSSGRIYLEGFHTSIIGSAHDDEIVDEASGKKNIDGGDGDDIVTLGGDAEDSVLFGGEGNDVLTGGDGRDLLFGGWGGDTLDGGDGNDVIIGDPMPTSETNLLSGGDGADHIVAGSGEDVVDGGDGHDYIRAVTGSIVKGGAGNDVIDFGDSGGHIVFDAGSGHDFIIASDVSNNNDDVIVYVEGLAASDVTIVVEEVTGFHCNLALVVDATGASFVLLHVPGGVESAILNITFEHGGPAAWPTLNAVAGSIAQYIVAPADHAAATAGDDDVDPGTGGADSLAGSHGDDALSGGDGDDSFAASAGTDGIDGGAGSDVLDLFGALGDYDLARAGNGIVSVEDRRGLEGSMTLVAVEALFFAAGNETFVMDELFGFAGTAGNDAAAFGRLDNVMAGLAGDDMLSGGDGHDSIDGGDGDDVLAGGGGDDQLSGGDGADTLSGGAGYDTLAGGLGGDRYLYAAGDEYDTLADEGGLDVLRFGAGLLAADLRAEISGDDYVLWFEGESGSVTILGGLLAAGEIEELRFEDETSWSAQDLYDLAYVPPIVGTAGDDPALVGDERDDDIQGLGGNDVIAGGGGDDLIDGGDGTDTAAYAGASDDFSVHFYQDGSLIVADHMETEGYDMLAGIEFLFFAGDSVAVDVGDVPHGTAGNDMLAGSARDDIVYALDGDDSLDGGGGDDLLFGGLGNDTYLLGPGDDEASDDGGDDLYGYDPGDGDDSIWEYLGFDALTFGAGIDPADVLVTGDGDSFILSFAGAAGSVTIRDGALEDHAIEEVRFFDTTVWTAADLHDMAFGALLMGFAPAGDRFPLAGDLHVV